MAAKTLVVFVQIQCNSFNCLVMHGIVQLQNTLSCQSMCFWMCCECLWVCVCLCVCKYVNIFAKCSVKRQNKLKCRIRGCYEGQLFIKLQLYKYSIFAVENYWNYWEAQNSENVKNDWRFQNFWKIYEIELWIDNVEFLWFSC